MESRIPLFVAMAYIFTLPASASPTSGDFVACHSRASSILLDCLNQHPGRKNSACWEKSKKANNLCYDMVQKEHRPDRARIETEKRLERERKNQLQR